MIRSRWAGNLPRRLVLVAAAALIPVVAGCEAGNDAPTLQFHYPTDAAGTAVGDLSIRNLFVLGAPLGRDLTKGESASVFLALINLGIPDKLISISAPGTAASVTLPAGGVPVVIGHPIYYAGPAPQIVLNDLTRTVRSGSSIPLVLTFQKAGEIRLQVPVMPRAAQYATFAPPAVTASPAAAGKHGAASPTPGPSAAGSATPSTSPSPMSPSPSAS